MGGGLAVFATLAEVTTEEDIVFIFAILDHAHFLAHAPFADHFAGDGGGLTDIASGAIGDITELQFFGDAAAHDDHESVDEFEAAMGVFVFGGKIHRGAEGGTAGDDRYLMEGIHIFDEFAEERVTGFMVSGVFFFFVAHGHAPAFATPADFIAGFFELVVGDGFQATSGGDEGGFVDDIGEFGARESWGASGDHGEIDGLGEFDLFGVDLEDGFAAFDIG